MIANRVLPLVVLAAFAATAFGGCVAPSDSGGGSGSGYTSFFVKDAPDSDFVSVNFTFTQVKVHQASDNASEDDNESASPTNSTAATNSTSPSGSAEAGNETDDDEGSGWIVLVNSTHTVDLKQFQGDASSFLGGANISAGKYTQIRIYVDSVVGTKTDGTVVNITVPSGTLKIVRPWTVEAGKETKLTVDVDLSKSILQTGNGEYKLKPTMKLVEEHLAHSSDEPTDATESGAGNGGAGNTSHPGGKPTNATHGKP